MIVTRNENPNRLFEIITWAPFTILYNGNFGVLVYFYFIWICFYYPLLFIFTIHYYSCNNQYKNILLKRAFGRYLRLNIPIVVAIFLSFLFYKFDLYFNVLASEISGLVQWLKKLYPDEILVLTTAKEAIYGPILFGNNTLIPPLWTL